MSMKNSKDTIRNRTHYLPACSAVYVYVCAEENNLIYCYSFFILCEWRSLNIHVSIPCIILVSLTVCCVV